MPLDYPTYAAQVLELACNTTFDCCDASERASLGVTYADTETCVRESSAASATSIDAVVELITNGAAVFDAARAAACLETLRAASCADRATEIGRADVCADVVSGTTAIGGNCLVAPCADGICADGVCVPYPAIGEPCDVACAGDAVCIEGTCDRPHAEGGSCESDLACQRGLFCRGTCVAVDRCVGG